MAITNHAELVSAIKGWLIDRDDLDARIPDFIMLCEADLNRRLRFEGPGGQIKRKTAVFTSARAPLPTDWLEAHGVRIQSGRQIRPTSQENLIDIQEDNPTATTPTHYALAAGEMELAPSPTGSTPCTVEMLYYAQIPALVTAPNWLIVEAPDVYLYGSLVHSATFIDDERLQTWVAAYDRLVQALNDFAQSARLSGGPLARRMRSYG